MTVTASVLIPAKTAEAAQTTQYTANNLTAIIDKFTATNYSVAAVTISVNLVTAGDTAGAQNVVAYLKTLQPQETYTFPEVVGHVLRSGGFISTLAGAVLSVNIRASGREIT